MSDDKFGNGFGKERDEDCPAKLGEAVTVYGRTPERVGVGRAGGVSAVAPDEGAGWVLTTGWTAGTDGAGWLVGVFLAVWGAVVVLVCTGGLIAWVLGVRFGEDNGWCDAACAGEAAAVRGNRSRRVSSTVRLPARRKVYNMGTELLSERSTTSWRAEIVLTP